MPTTAGLAQPPVDLARRVAEEAADVFEGRCAAHEPLRLRFERSWSRPLRDVVFAPLVQLVRQAILLANDAQLDQFVDELPGCGDPACDEPAARLFDWFACLGVE